jgi:hypothetical protein
MPSPEDRPEINVYQGQHFEAEISETADTFTAQINSGEEVIVFSYTPPGQFHVEIVSFTPSSAPRSLTSERVASPETEKAVRIYGRTATDPFKATAPSGEPMTIVSFAEHPSYHPESFANTEPDKVKKDTRYWQAAAFGQYAQLLDGIPKGKACILIGYPKPITRIGKEGKAETANNGFQVVNKQPYVGTPKPRQ